MKLMHRLLVVLVGAGLLITSCSAKEEQAPEAAPVQVEHMEGQQPTRVTLTADAARRLDLQTGSVRVEEVNGAQATVIPYASIIYDTEGNTWIYTSPESLTFVRTPVHVESIRDQSAIITDGLAAGTAVVTVGAEELFGSETEFEEE